jgi:hypothetical protein
MHHCHEEITKMSEYYLREHSKTSWFVDCSNPSLNRLYMLIQRPDGRYQFTLYDMKTVASDLMLYKWHDKQSYDSLQEAVDDLNYRRNLTFKGVYNNGEIRFN